jgi:hypothetical protein
VPDVKITTVLEGVPNFVRAVQRTDERTRVETIAAVKRGAEIVAAKARARAPRRSGELAETIRPEPSKNEMVFYVKAGYGKLLRRSRANSSQRAAKQFAKQQSRREGNKLQLALANNSRQALSVVDLGVYAPVVERGDRRRHKPKRPFLVPSLVEEREAIAADIKRAPERAAREAGLE